MEGVKVIKNKEIRNLSGGYLGVILGTAFVQVILQGRIEHWKNQLIVAVCGYLVLLVMFILIAFIRRKIKG